ncbi:hypothetical protein BC828DRAFT_395340 [Blastocladiella britannica]|nr:hypothetical protein BC828DRAFT_395340 [Blastocladiella britannica]
MHIPDDRAQKPVVEKIRAPENDSGDDDGEVPMSTTDEQPQDLDPDQAMAAMMGFGGFDSTKDKNHTDVGGAKVKKPPKYRQYMNLAKRYMPISVPTSDLLS